MKHMRIYIDTSVFGGCFDEEFKKPSKALFRAIKANRATPLISDILIAELARAPQVVQDLLSATLKWGNAEQLEVTKEALSLQQAYISAGIVVPKYADDGLHVAHATIARADVIVSWNFRHLVNPAQIRAFNGINLANGYGMIVILSPEAVIMMEEKENEKG
jgi:predicted nucleic acid-binding protein